MKKKETSSESGGKLNRSETVSVRLDQKLRYLADLAARKQRRTVSSFIEWAVEQSLREVKLYIGSGFQGDQDVSVEDEANQLWDVDESERFVRLAIRYPELLTHQEQETWKLLLDSTLLHPARSRRNNVVHWDWGVLEDMVFPKLRKHWPDLTAAYSQGMPTARQWVEKMESEVASGSVYPKLVAPGPKKTAPSQPAQSFDEFDDDIPF